MKRRGGYTLAIGLLFAGFYSMATPAKVNAAACENVSNYGAVRLYVPDLPESNDYQLWIRMQSPGNSGKVLVELNSTSCYEVASSLLTPNSWTWIPYYQNNKNTTISFSETDGNQLKLIGIQDSVKIDRVLLTSPTCTPEDIGDNCSDGIEPAFSQPDTIQEIAPPSDQPVKGKVIVSNTPFTQSADLASVTYSASGRTLQSELTAQPFDTTLLENGKHTIFISTNLKDGTTIRESTVITIENQENVLSPIRRWLRLQERSLVVLGLGIAGVVVVLVLLAVMRKIYIKRRERKFHGF